MFRELLKVFKKESRHPIASRMAAIFTPHPVSTSGQATTAGQAGKSWRPGINPKEQL
jgi:hypothetical protein